MSATTKAPETATPLPSLHDLFINGDWVKPQGDKYLDVINPTDEEVVQRVAAGDAHDIDAAVAAAKQAFVTWGKTSGKERAVYLRAMADAVQANLDELSKLETIDCGKPLAESAWDMEDVVGCFQYYADAAEKLDAQQNEPVDLGNEEFRGHLRYEAMGVVGAIIPWNYPALMEDRPRARGRVHGRAQAVRVDAAHGASARELCKTSRFACRCAQRRDGHGRGRRRAARQPPGRRQGGVHGQRADRQQDYGRGG